MKADEIGPSLLAAFARVPDVRSRFGRHYPLPALLALATAAMLAGARSLYAISQWGRLQPSEVRRALGFPEGGMPAATTLHYVFKRLDTPRFEAALQQWAAAALQQTDRQLVLDGKALRGIHGEQLPGVRLVAVYAPTAGLVLAQAGGQDQEEAAQTADERAQAKQEAELSVAPRLLAQVRPLVRGRVVSGDALYCQKALCRQIRQAGGDYLLAVKGNQANLQADVTLLFEQPPPGERFGTSRTVTQHGGRLEVRQLRASASLASYLCEAGWADVGLVLEVTATVRWPRHPAKGTRHEVRYFLSSLPAQTPPTAALALVRQHWHIENRLHWPRDVTLGEDACQVRSGRAPQALAAVRNAVVGVLHQRGVGNLAAALRANAWSGAAAVLAFLGLKL